MKGRSRLVGKQARGARERGNECRPMRAKKGSDRFRGVYCMWGLESAATRGGETPGDRY